MQKASLGLETGFGSLERHRGVRHMLRMAVSTNSVIEYPLGIGVERFPQSVDCDAAVFSGALAVQQDGDPFAVDKVFSRTTA